VIHHRFAADPIHRVRGEGARRIKPGIFLTAKEAKGAKNREDLDESKPSVVLTRLFPELLLIAMLPFQTHIALALAAGTAAFLAANLLLELLAFGFDPLGLLLELFTKRLAGDVAIHDPGAVLLALDLESGGLVLEVNTGSRLVDLLPPTTRAADEFFHEVLIEDP